jgi:predicted NUDIX family NTP pyrophosphohydrolase
LEWFADIGGSKVMARKQSAAILLYKVDNQRELTVLLVHPGGPFWAKKDTGAWSLPKGEYDEDEDPLVAAKREFAEETGSQVEANQLLELGSVKQKNGKIVVAWAVEGDFDTSGLRCNSFTMEWPRGSGSIREFPEVDRAEWFGPEIAREKMVIGQDQLIDRLIERLAERGIVIEERAQAHDTLF